MDDSVIIQLNVLKKIGKWTVKEVFNFSLFFFVHTLFQNRFKMD